MSERSGQTGMPLAIVGGKVFQATCFAMLEVIASSAFDAGLRLGRPPGCLKTVAGNVRSAPPCAILLTDLFRKLPDILPSRIKYWLSLELMVFA